MNKNKYLNLYAVLTAILIALFVVAIIQLSKQYYLVNIIVVLTVLWGIFAFEYAMNGAPFWKCFKEDLKLYKPQGETNRVNYIKDQFDNSENLTLLGKRKSWSKDNKIFTEKDYIDCANDVIGKGYYFWISKFATPLIILTYITHLHFHIF